MIREWLPVTISVQFPQVRLGEFRLGEFRLGETIHPSLPTAGGCDG